MPWHWDCLWPVPSEPSDCGLRLKSSRKESWPSLPHSSFFPWHLQEGNAWFSSSCSQRCTCQAGAIQCRAFACPASSRCETDEDGKEICKPYSKGALRRCSRGGEPRLGLRGPIKQKEVISSLFLVLEAQPSGCSSQICLSTDHYVQVPPDSMSLWNSSNLQSFEEPLRLSLEPRATLLLLPLLT